MLSRSQMLLGILLLILLPSAWSAWSAGSDTPRIRTANVRPYPKLGEFFRLQFKIENIYYGDDWAVNYYLRDGRAKKLIYAQRYLKGKKIVVEPDNMGNSPKAIRSEYQLEVRYNGVKDYKPAESIQVKETKNPQLRRTYSCEATKVTWHSKDGSSYSGKSLERYIEVFFASSTPTYVKSDCKIANDLGIKYCQLPFTYAGKTYTTCATYLNQAWCGITPVYKSGHWCYCDLERKPGAATTTTTTTTTTRPTTTTRTTFASTTPNPRLILDKVLKSCTFGSNMDEEGTLCDFQQDGSDQFNWILINKRFDKRLTGPDVGYGNDMVNNGFYMYMDSTMSSAGGAAARVYITNWNYVGPVCVKFAYYMYGWYVNELNLYTQANERSERIKLWKEGTKRDGLKNWQTTFLDVSIVSNTQRVGFEGLRGTRMAGDIAVDEVIIEKGMCSELASCKFGTTIGTFCDFNQNRFIQGDLTDNFDWSITKKHTRNGPTGPSKGYGESGYYIYIKSGRPWHWGDEARIYTHPLGYEGQVCVKFYYHMYGKDIRKLVLFTQNPDRYNKTTWTVLTGNKGPKWIYGNEDVHLTDPNQMIGFAGFVGKGSLGDIAIDEVNITKGRCLLPDIENEDSLGCYTINKARWTYISKGETAFFDDPEMTVGKCIQTCKDKKYSYAGLHYGDRCICNSRIRFQNFTQDSNECKVKCPGKADQTCGGYNYIQVHRAGPITQSVKEGSIGCFDCQGTVNRRKVKVKWMDETRSKSGEYPDRFEPVATTPANLITPKYCIDLCTSNSTKWRYAALFNGDICLCNTLFPATSPQESPQRYCNLKCGGDSDDTCGSSYAIQIYPTGPPMFDSIGCYKYDSKMSEYFNKPYRTLPMTILHCKGHCYNNGLYKYYGLYRGTWCLCGDKLAAESITDYSKCNIPCEGYDGYRVCGGKHFIQIHETAAGSNQQGGSQRQISGGAAGVTGSATVVGTVVGAILVVGLAGLIATLFMRFRRKEVKKKAPEPHD